MEESSGLDAVDVQAYFSFVPLKTQRIHTSQSPCNRFHLRRSGIRLSRKNYKLLN